MDGNTIDLDPKTAEALRQKKVFAEAMASLERKKRKNEAMGYAVMAAASGFQDASREGTRLGRLVNLSKFFLVVGVGAIVNYFFYAFVMNG